MLLQHCLQLLPSHASCHWALTGGAIWSSASVLPATTTTQTLKHWSAMTWASCALLPISHWNKCIWHILFKIQSVLVVFFSCCFLLGGWYKKTHGRLKFLEPYDTVYDFWMYPLLWQAVNKNTERLPQQFPFEKNWLHVLYFNCEDVWCFLTKQKKMNKCHTCWELKRWEMRLSWRSMVVICCDQIPLHSTT